MLDVNPVEMNPDIIKRFKASADKKHLSYEMMLSGAGHDAMVMGALTDVGLFLSRAKAAEVIVPKNGRIMKTCKKESN